MAPQQPWNPGPIDLVSDNLQLGQYAPDNLEIHVHLNDKMYLRYSLSLTSFLFSFSISWNVVS